LKSPAKKAIKPQPHYKLTPRSAAKIQPRGYGKKLSVFDDQPPSALTPAKVVASPDIFQSRLKLTIDPEAEMPEVTPMKVKKSLAPPPQSPYVAPSAASATQPIPVLQLTSPSGEARDLPATPAATSSNRPQPKSLDLSTPSDRIISDPAVGTTVATPTPKRITPGTVQATPFEETSDDKLLSKNYSTYADFSKDNNISIAKSGETNGSTKSKGKEYLPILTRPGYFTVPDFETLSEMTPAELSKIRDFTVGRPKFGKITFKGETDVRGLNLDEIILFQPHQIEVYPDGTDKPLEGQGLNKQAVVTLERCWPKDPKGGVIKEPSRRLDRFIKKLRMRSGTKFVNYHVATGEWSFEVDSF